MPKSLRSCPYLAVRIAGDGAGAMNKSALWLPAFEGSIDIGIHEFVDGGKDILVARYMVKGLGSVFLHPSIRQLRVVI